MTPHEVAALLLRLKAVRVSVNPPFTWTSGMKAPIYCDNRLVLGHPDERTQIVEALVEAIRRLPHQPEVIAGTATAGIGWAALVADRLHLPMVYVRPKPKEHGAGKQVEGELKAESHAVVVEDLISTGGSSIGTVTALRKERNCTVSDIVAIFTYGFPKAEHAAKEAGVTLHALSTFPTLLEVARERRALPENDIATAAVFSENPEEWAKHL